MPQPHPVEVALRRHQSEQSDVGCARSRLELAEPCGSCCCPQPGARGEVPDLTPLLPLFEELVAYASEAEMSRSYKPSIEATRREYPAVAARLHESKLRRVRLLEAQLAEVRQLLAPTD